ncbi:hypothetical protein MKK55_00155 [Methylobacterium sp. J-059]|uniref:hypothetical protein n=1 Tax=Methylobacterium sp. J-059 TaxID=2836643 RepID=UPI001FBAE580|nr:hypothetical protein [Methylobacterium sp. J-059]MCJ2037383.1 hypothetical protein [Methylobacterium sp. J-059]
MPQQPSLADQRSHRADDAGRSPAAERDAEADDTLAQARIEKHREAANHVRMTVTGNAANAEKGDSGKDDQ